MKKLLFILCVLSLTFLISFAAIKPHHPKKKEAKVTTASSCGVPTNLTAVKQYTTQIALDWDLSTVNLINCNYGGYYNCSDCVNGGPGSKNFSGTTNTWPIAIPCTPGTYSIHFGITANCNDGSHNNATAYVVF